MNSPINVNDDVIIGGAVISVDYDSYSNQYEYKIRLNSYKIIKVYESDIKSYHPYTPKPDKDERKGN